MTGTEEERGITAVPKIPIAHSFGCSIHVRRPPPVYLPLARATNAEFDAAADSGQTAARRHGEVNAYEKPSLVDLTNYQLGHSHKLWHERPEHRVASSQATTSWDLKYLRPTGSSVLDDNDPA
ncbi:hypothetical protein MCOR24_004826 [Pyricularia oryzae]|nr:hypothetical protein MCOR24_004826 [Pyricularia oryzae]